MLKTTLIISYEHIISSTLIFLEITYLLPSKHRGQEQDIANVQTKHKEEKAYRTCRRFRPSWFSSPDQIQNNNKRVSD